MVSFCLTLVTSKYRRNCEERVHARQDVPLARTVQTDEELQRQSEHLQRITQLRAMYIRLSTGLINFHQALLLL